MAKTPAPAAATEPAPAWKPTWTYRLLTSFLLAGTVGVAIGALAVIDQYLQYVSVVYDGSDVRFAGRTVKINYCMLSGGVAGSIDSRCNYAFTVAAISLAISALWAIHEAARRRGKPPAMFYVGSWGLPWLGAVWWLVAGVLLSVWTSASNAGGLPGAVQRNGLCAMAFIIAGLFTVLALLLMFKPDSPLATKLYNGKTKKADCPAGDKAKKSASPGAAEPTAPATAAAHVGPASGGAWDKSPAAPATAKKAAQAAADAV